MVYFFPSQTGQASLPDLLLATFLFFILLAGLVYYSNALQNDAQTVIIRRPLDASASNLAEYIIKNQGTPSNWETLSDANQIKQIGLAQKDRVLNPNKVVAFVNQGNLNYFSTKERMGISYYDFYVQFSGGISLSTGIAPPPNKNASVVQRLVTLNGAETKFTLTLYEP
jgi:hypothetical protein